MFSVSRGFHIAPPSAHITLEEFFLRRTVASWMILSRTVGHILADRSQKIHCRVHLEIMTLTMILWHPRDLQRCKSLQNDFELLLVFMSPIFS